MEETLNSGNAALNPLETRKPPQVNTEKNRMARKAVKTSTDLCLASGQLCRVNLAIEYTVIKTTDARATAADGPVREDKGLKRISARIITAREKPKAFTFSGRELI